MLLLYTNLIGINVIIIIIIVTMEIGPYHVIKVYKQKKDILVQGPDHCHCQHP